MNFKPNIPIYMQIMDEIKKNMINGIVTPGDKISSVRELALQYGVNPNTVQRALAQLEQETLVFTERTSGRYITKDMQIIQAMKEEFINGQMDCFIDEIRELGLQDKEIIEGIKGRLQHGKHC